MLGSLEISAALKRRLDFDYVAGSPKRNSTNTEKGPCLHSPCMIVTTIKTLEYIITMSTVPSENAGVVVSSELECPPGSGFFLGVLGDSAHKASGSR